MTVPWGTAPYTTEGFLLDEEAGLKDHLLGMVVSDIASNSRNVGVWFAHPDKEKRDAAYPYGVITLIDIGEARDRMMVGRQALSIVPDWVTIPGNGILEGDLPVPVNLDYQFQVYTRNPRHSRQVMAQLMNYKTPLRGGRLRVVDGTYRRMDVLGFGHRESDETNKRLFVETVSLRISSEMTPNNINNRPTTAPITTPKIVVSSGVPSV